MRKGKSPCNVCGHDLTWAEFYTLNAVQDYLRKNSGDSSWSSHCSPRGDGRQVPIKEIFSARNSRDNARRQTVRRLHLLGVLKACEIELKDGLLRGLPHPW